MPKPDNRLSEIHYSLPQGAASEDLELNLDWEDGTTIAIVVADP